MKEYTVKLKVLCREFEPGKERTHDLQFDAELVTAVPHKYNLFIQCLRQFGRCAGRIPMGWRFERIEKFDDGSKRWTEYQVLVIEGAQPDSGFHLVKEDK